MVVENFKAPLLISYAYFKDKLFGVDYEIIERVRRGEVKLLIDSGAFTAFTKGKHISLSEYLSFIDRLKAENIEFNYAQLDVIGNPQATSDNLLTMHRQGYCDTLPVFTRGERIEQLEDLYEMNDYIMLGGVAVGDTVKHYVKWFLERNQNRKVHLLGFTESNILAYYKPTSVDSSGSEASARFGGWPYYNNLSVKSRPAINNEVINFYRGYGLLPYVSTCSKSLVCNDKLFLGRLCYLLRAMDLKSNYDVDQYLAITTNLSYFYKACDFLQEFGAGYG